MTFAAVAVAGVGAAVSIGTSMASADAKADANSEAGRAAAAAAAQARKDINTGVNTATGYMQPYSKVGRSALDELSQQMGLGGSYGQGDVPTANKRIKTDDPAWQAIIAKYNPKGKSWTANNKMRQAYQAASREYLNQKNQVNQLGESTNPNAGNLTKDFGMEDYKNDPGYTPFVNTLEDLQATPGYQFRLKQGLDSANNSASARGSLLSGAQLKSLNNYGSEFASTEYNNAYTRAQQSYQNAFARDTTNKTNKFSRLQSMANNGQSASGTQGGYQMQGANAKAGIATNLGDQQATLALAQGQNEANMYTGIGNGINSFTGSVAGNPAMMSKIGGWINGPTPAAGGPTDLPKAKV